MCRKLTVEVGSENPAQPSHFSFFSRSQVGSEIEVLIFTAQIAEYSSVECGSNNYFNVQCRVANQKSASVSDVFVFLTVVDYRPSSSNDIR